MCPESFPLSFPISFAEAPTVATPWHLTHDLRIYYDSLTGSDVINCWCSRWDVDNYSIVAETWLKKNDLQTLRNNIRPGATKELYRILGRPRFTDTSWTECYSKDTDILTEDGWMSIKELVDNQLQIRVATLNPQEDITEYHYPLKYIKYQYNGKMFHQFGGSIDFLVTPDHRVWCRKHARNSTRINNGYEFIFPSEIPKTVQYRRDFPYSEGVELPSFHTIPEYSNTWASGRDCKLIQTYRKPERKIPMDVWMKFIGWYLSEGNLSGDRRIHIGQSWTVNPNNCSEIECIINQMGYKVKYCKIREIHGAYRICDVQLANELKKFGKDKDRYIPIKYKKSKLKYLKLLLDSLMKGDGHIDKNGEYHSFSNSSKRLIDDVAEIAIKCGYVVTIGEKRKDGVYAITFSGKRYNNLTNTGRDKREWIDYDDFVYSVEVPNGIIYTRRNGKSCWNGNSNTLKLSPHPSSQLHNMRNDTLGFVRNITTSPLEGSSGWLSVKLEMNISGSSSL